MQRPAFIAFTGVDRVELAPGMRALSAQYPIEWGVLVDADRADKPLFPSWTVRQALLATPSLRWAAHVCGARARAIASGAAGQPLDLAGFQRVQVNHSFSGSDAAQVANVRDFGRRWGMRTVLQCSGAFPADPDVDWLFDVSFGAGEKPAQWPSLTRGGPFCGYSGGIGPETVDDVLRAIGAPEGAIYWIDMESGVRTDGWLDLEKCRRVCEAVYG